jgi:ADP-dependent phosphofructokinase/glucokinase
MDGLLLSGFHMMIETYPDGSTFMDTAWQSSGTTGKVCSINNDLSIHLEFATLQ